MCPQTKSKSAREKMEPNVAIDPMYRPYVKDPLKISRAIPPVRLLTWNRFDLAIKLSYLRNRNRQVRAFFDAYRGHIKSFSLGSFTEPGNSEKNSIDKYLYDFESIFTSIKTIGFDDKVSVIPIANDGSIVNGSHRTASAIELGSEVATIELTIPPALYDWKFFHRRGFPSKFLDMSASEFVRQSDNVYIAIFWPRSVRFHKEMSQIIERKVYEKKIHLSAHGIRNLLSICYQNEEWLGPKKNNFPGIVGKHREVNRKDASTHAIAFQANNINHVRAIKEQLRDIAEQGKHSVHITDSRQDSKQLSQILFNDNGIHFLNNANPNTFSTLDRKIESIATFSRKNDISSDDILVDSSLVLELYGVRIANDIDILANGNVKSHPEAQEVHTHDDQLQHHNQSKNTLIYDPEFHFVYKGIKFLSFNQLLFFKHRRRQGKDVSDIRIMASATNTSSLNKIKRKLRGKVLSWIDIFRYHQHRLIKHMRKFGLYWTVRRIKRLILNDDS